MTKSEVKIGATYVVNHTSGRIHVRINRTVTRGGWGDTNEVIHWIGTNLRTGREIEIKSARKLLREVKEGEKLPPKPYTRADAMRDCGLTRVRGAMGGIYYE